VCYAHADESVVYPEIRWLQDQGINAWYDEGISAGRIWRTEIGESLLGATHVLFYISKHSLESDHCNREINLALDERKEVLPLYLEDVALTTDLKVGLSRVQALHRDQDEHYQQHLLNALGHVRVIEPTMPQQRLGRDEARPLIAVLPLDNLSGDPAQEYVADGMTEELISELARLSGLEVISRTSVMHYKGARPLMSTIISELGVDWVLEGSVMREANRFRVTVQLIDARTDTHHWSDRFDREARSVLALYTDVARAVASQLPLVLTSDEEQTLASAVSVNPEAYDAYLRALRLWGSAVDYRVWGQRVIEAARAVVELDSEFAAAWALLAGSYFVASQDDPHQFFPPMRQAAQKAVSLDKRLGVAHTLLGHVALKYDWNLTASDVEYELGILLSPSDVGSLLGQCESLLNQGRFAEVVPALQRMLRVAPLDRFHRPLQIGLHARARYPELALEHWADLQQLWPGFVDYPVVDVLEHLSRYEDAHRARIGYYERLGSDRLTRASEDGWARGGFEGSLRAIAATLHRPKVFLARLLAQLGEMDQAFELLETAVEAHEFMVPELSNPYCDVLRLDPRVDDLLERIGLPIAQPEHPARMADVGRIMAFRSRAPEAVSRLEGAMAASSNDVRLPRWFESMAYAHLALGDYDQTMIWAQRTLEHDLSTHAGAFANLLMASSYAQLDRTDAASEALGKALNLWPRLAIDRDLLPLFMGGDTDMRDRYVAGLHKAGFGS
jgi:TolB-like protein